MALATINFNQNITAWKAGRGGVLQGAQVTACVYVNKKSWDFAVYSQRKYMSNNYGTVEQQRGGGGGGGAKKKQLQKKSS